MVGQMGGHQGDTKRRTAGGLRTGMPRLSLMLLRLGGFLALALIPFTAPAVQAQSVHGKVLSIGFPFSSIATPHTIREGQWFPILVELGTEEQQLTLDLRVECSDLDGDRIHYDREAITLGADDGLRKIWCYGVTSRQGSGFNMSLALPKSVDLIAGDRKIGDFPIPAFTLAGPMDKLILDISSDSVTFLNELSANAELQDPAIANRKYYRKYYIARAQATDAIPDLWYGLESLDVVVWDRADPRSGQIGRNQLSALLKWVERGGHLIVGIGDQADVIRETELADYLPVELTGGSRPVDEFPRFDTAFVIEALRGPLSSPAPVANCIPRKDAVVVMEDQRGGIDYPLIVMQQVGAGRVTVMTAPLASLLRVGTDVKALHALLDFNPLSAEYVKDEQNLAMRIQATLSNTQIAPDVQSAVSFARQGGFLALLATFFVASYIALATLVSWFWLKKLDRLAMSWPIFGLFAIAASFLSLGTVRVSRGLTATVHELSLVDMRAYSTEATSACWFGYRSPNRETPTFSLPTVYEDRQILTDNYLRPLTPLENSRYATPHPYTARVGFAELQDVLIRSTVKQFEGFWKGDVNGDVQAQLYANRATGQITDKSFLTNKLPGDVRAGAILYVDPRSIGAVPLKAAGLTSSHRPEFDGKAPPAANVLVVPLGEIKAGDELRNNIGRSFYQAMQNDMLASQQRNPNDRDPEDRKRWRDLQTLRDVQRNYWRSPGWTPATSALAELSFHDLDLPGGQNFYDFNVAGPRLSIEGLVDYDISHWLIQGQAVILLVVEEPGPAVLYRQSTPQSEAKPWPANQGETLYRIRVPLDYVGNPLPQPSMRGVRP